MRLFPRAWLWLSIAGLLAVTLRCPGGGVSLPPGAGQFHQSVEPILNEYCYDCHGAGENRGGVSFDEFESDKALLADRDLWWNALKYLRTGMMPPAGKPRPTVEQQQRIAEWIKTSVFGIDLKNPDPGRVTVRRLNRIEYRNSILDLLGVDFNTAVEFPADDTGYGFDNIGDVLTVSPMLLEKYIAAARTILAQAVPTLSRVIPELTVTGTQFREAGAGVGSPQQRGRPASSTLSLPYSRTASVAAMFNLQHDGSYELNLDLAIKGNFGFETAKCRVAFKLDDQELVRKDFAWFNDKPFPFKFKQDLKAGTHHLTLEVHPVDNDEGRTNGLLVRLVGVTVRGPADEQYWTRPKNYGRWFAKEAPEKPAERMALAREILRVFASKAYRRPVDNKTADRLAALSMDYSGQPGKTFEAGVGHAMEAVISSPRFVFRIEENVPASGGAAWSQVDEYSLASRLSYFLWSTMPDDELMRLAQRGELRKNLSAQVKRLLDDPRSQAMVENFTGQWLELRDLSGLAINARAVLARDDGTESELRAQAAQFQAAQLPQKPPVPALSAATNAPASHINVLASDATPAKAVPGNLSAADAPDAGRAGRGNPNGQANPQLRGANRGGFRFPQPRFQLDAGTKAAMKSETEMFFASVVHEDRPVIELLDSDYTFLNEKLANHYGLTNLNITGTEMRRVTLPADSPRGGIITEGAVLAVTSNPDRTSPVKRGLFVLNNILGTPAPPPPPNVPALEASEKDFTNRPTLRVVLEAHRSQPLCASCHARMDPIGLSLENFNALGLWRDKERNQPVNPAGQLITGEPFKDVRELKKILVSEHSVDFYRCLTQKLLTYALGRGLEDYDTETVDRIVQRLQDNHGRFSALLTGIVDSAPFQERRIRANATFSALDQTSGARDASQISKILP